MNRPPDEVLARRLAPAPGDEAYELTPVELEASLDAVTAVLEARSQVQTLRRRVRGVAALAAAVLLFTVWWLRPQPGLASVEVAGVVSDVTSSRARVVTSGAPIEAGQRVKTDETGTFTLRFSDGSIATVGARSELGIHGLGPHRSFELALGHFEAQVSKLQSSATFVVATRRARVEVRGTRFSVDVEPASPSCPDGSVTVKVEEGVVAVTAAEVVHEVKTGESKTLPCTTLPVEPPPRPRVPSTPTPKRTPDDSSPLSRMNAMYGAALELKQGGQLEASAAAFNALRRTFPKSALDEAAAVEELRLLEKLGSPRGPDAAREYLRDYPEGYGRDVAERLVTP